MKRLQLLGLMLLLCCCAHKNNKEDTNKYASQFVKDYFPYSGKYVWAFNLMSSHQVSTHTFYSDSIVYSMIGKVYATDYTMKKLSYDNGKNKWIGEDENGIVYVLFFKDKTDSTLTIYKHKCKTNGLQEALSFDVPSSTATSDHGWNRYSLNGKVIRDVLSLSGNYSSTTHKIGISDQMISIDDKNIEKVSFHSGERRWVGLSNGHYVQLFFKSLAHPEHLEIAIQWSDNPEELYSTKYTTITNWETYAKQ